MLGDDRLNLLGQTVPAAAVGENPLAVPHVAGHRAIFLHFVEFGDVDDGERIFLAFDHLGLQCRIDLGKINAGRCCAKRLEHRGPQRADRHADLEALQVVSRVDRLGRGGDVAVAVVENPVEGVQVDLGHGGADEGAEFTVHRRPHGLIILERKRQTIDAGQRHQGLQDQAGQRKNINRARAHLRQHVGVAAQLVVREHLNVHLAIGFFFDRLDRFTGADVGRVRDRNIVGPLERELGGLGKRGAAECGKRAGGGGALNESAAL